MHYLEQQKIYHKYDSAYLENTRLLIIPPTYTFDKTIIQKSVPQKNVYN